jgi:hypothetical protein
VYRVDDAKSRLVDESDVESRRKDNNSRGVYRTFLVPLPPRRKDYHLSEPIVPYSRPSQGTYDEPDYSYKDAAGMFRDTEPAPRRA